MGFLISFAIIDGAFCAFLIGVSTWLTKILPKPQIAALVVMVFQGLALDLARMRKRLHSFWNNISHPFIVQWL